jgi:diguanylate cyclase (GGDEF)-like protein
MGAQIHANTEQDRLRTGVSAPVAAVKTQLLRVVRGGGLNMDIAGALAGDRELSSRERSTVKRLIKEKGEGFYTDLLLQLTHQPFSGENAKRLWCRIVKHKKELSDALGRNVGLVVGAADYFRNFSGLVETPTMISAKTLCRVAEVALKDGLTDLYDHATFKMRLNNELRRYHRYGDGFSLMMIDIDDFKQLNDTYGHQVGDRVLVSVANALQAEVRETDTVGRYGGEEFAVLVPRTSVEETLELAERIRAAVEEEFHGSLDVTISIGVAGCPRSGTTASDLLERADQALYRAKDAGKNQIGCDGPEGEA